jgi:putative transposon-encoded protein
MEVCESVLKSWGNSAAVIIPKGVVERENLRIGKKVKMLVAPGGDGPAKTWGMLKGHGLSGQECKDWARSELYND